MATTYLDRRLLGAKREGLSQKHVAQVIICLSGTWMGMVTVLVEWMAVSEQRHKKFSHLSGFLPLSENSWMKKEWIISQYVTPVSCYYTLTNSQDQTFITVAIKVSIYRQRREQSFSQDKIQLTVKSTQCDFDSGYFYYYSKGTGL